MVDLRDRVLVVTGASSGIGASTAVEAGRAKMRVVLAARRLDKLEQVAACVRRAGGLSHVIVTDVGDPRQVADLVGGACDRFGRIDAMFANAGFGFFHRAADPTHEGEEQRMWRVNYFGAVACVRATVERMRAQGGGGHVLFNASIAALTGLPWKATYSATKGALHGYATTLRMELAGSGIHVTTVYPIGTDTEFSGIAHSGSRDDAPRASAPRGMGQSPEHVARRIVACLRRPRPEVWPSRASHLAAAIWALLPRFRGACFARYTRDHAVERPASTPDDDAG